MSLKPITKDDLKNSAKYVTYLKKILAADVPSGTRYTYFQKFKFFGEEKKLPIITFGVVAPDLLESIEKAAPGAKVRKGKVESAQSGGKRKLQFDKGGLIYRAVIENTYRIPDSVVVAKDDSEEGGTELPGANTVARPAEQTDFSKAKKEKKLGKGAFGEVYRIKSDGAPKVLKTLQDNDGREEMEREAKMYEKIGAHPNIAKCYGIQTIEGEEGLVLEEVKGGELKEVFQRFQELKEDDELTPAEYWTVLQHMVGGTLRGLAAMEEVGIVHNDIKTDNILVDPVTMEPKIVDFGLSRRQGEERGQKQPVKFQAPEVNTNLLGGKNTPSDAEQDAFSAGQILHEQTEGGLFAFGKQLQGWGDISLLEAAQTSIGFSERDEKGEAKHRVLTPATPGREANQPGKYAKGFNSAFVDFINQLMHPDPKKRLTPSQALKHPFLTDGFAESGLVDKEKLFAKLRGEAQQPAPPPPVGTQQIDKPVNSISPDVPGERNQRPASEQQDAVYIDPPPQTPRPPAPIPRDRSSSKGIYDQYVPSPASLKGQPPAPTAPRSTPQQMSGVYVDVIPGQTQRPSTPPPPRPTSETASDKQTKSPASPDSQRSASPVPPSQAQKMSGVYVDNIPGQTPPPPAPRPRSDSKSEYDQYSVKIPVSPENEAPPPYTPPPPAKILADPPPRSFSSPAQPPKKPASPPPAPPAVEEQNDSPALQSTPPPAPTSLFGRKPGKATPSDINAQLASYDSAFAKLKSAPSGAKDVAQAISGVDQLRTSIVASLQQGRTEDAERQLGVLKQKLDTANNAFYVYNLQQQAWDIAFTTFKPGAAAELKKKFSKAPAEFSAVIAAVEKAEKTPHTARLPAIQNVGGAANAYLQHWANYKEKDKKSETTMALHAEATRLLGLANQVGLAFKTITK